MNQPMYSMTRCLKNGFLAAGMLFSVSLSAQTGFAIAAGSAVVSPTQQFCIPVTVQDFDCMIDFQFCLKWDPLVISFDTSYSQNLPDESLSFFGNAHETGILGTLWYDDSPGVSGVTLPDGAAVFEVCFTAIGAVGSSTAIEFSTAGFSPGSQFLEAVNCNWESVWNGNSATNGFVSIEDGASVLSVSSVSDNALMEVAPNPFSGQTWLAFTLTEAAPIQIRVADVTGRIVLEEKRNAIAGENRIEISGSQLPAEGYYRVMIQTAERQFGRSVLYFKD